MWYVAVFCHFYCLGQNTECDDNTVNDDDPGYLAKFKEASVNNFGERVADMKSIADLKIATALDPR